MSLVVGHVGFVGDEVPMRGGDGAFEVLMIRVATGIEDGGEIKRRSGKMRFDLFATRDLCKESAGSQSPSTARKEKRLSRADLNGLSGKLEQDGK